MTGCGIGIGVIVVPERKFAMFVGSGLEVLLWGAVLALAGLPVRYISRWLNREGRATRLMTED